MPHTRNPMDETRWTLLRRLHDWDDNTSWQEFFNIYWKLIFNTSRKKGLNEQEAEEVVQETIITITKKMRDLKLDPAFGSFKGWLYQTIQWRILDQLRKRRPQNVAPPSSQEGSTPLIERIPDPASMDADRYWERDWERNLADAALEKLKAAVKPKHYKIYYLHRVKEQPAKKVAARLGVSVNTVYVVSHRLGKRFDEFVLHLQTEFY